MNALEQELVAYYYGESADPAAVEKLLSDDPSARLLYDELSAMLADVQPSDPPERGDGYPEQIWEQIQWRLDPPRRGRWWEFLGMRQLVPAAVLAGLIIAAFLVGRHSAGPAVAPGISEQARQQILLVAVGDHLDRSQLVLFELLNAPAEGVLDVRGEQEQAGDLLTDNRLYRTTAGQSGNPLISDVLDDLERVLIEVRNGPERLAPADIARLRAMLAERDTLFKIRILNANIREERQGQVRSPETQRF
jgi:hypothetical protein